MVESGHSFQLPWLYNSRETTGGVFQLFGSNSRVFPANEGSGAGGNRMLSSLLGTIGSASSADERSTAFTYPTPFFSSHRPNFGQARDGLSDDAVLPEDFFLACAGTSAYHKSLGFEFQNYWCELGLFGESRYPLCAPSGLPATVPCY